MNGNYGWLRNDSKKKEKVHFLIKFCEHTQRIHINMSPKWGQSLNYFKSIRKKVLINMKVSRTEC